MAVMQERGIDLFSARPQKLTDELARGANLLVTMGCGEQCPFIPGLRRADWPLPDPKGKEIEHVHRIRDKVDQRVRRLLREILS
jgi:arsenate reductase (thioredoxin)